MKNLRNKIVGVLSLLVLLVPVAAAAIPNPVLDSAGLYKVAKAGTTSWSTSTTVSPGDTVAFMVHIHNGKVDSVANNVAVKATLPSGVVSNFNSTATVSSANTAAVSANVAVTLTEASRLEYVSGSTVMYNHNNQLEANLPDGITAGGIQALAQLKGCWEYERWIIFKARVVAAPKDPVCKISIDPSSVTRGGKATLSYTTYNATSASIDQGIGNVSVGSGSRVVNPKEDTKYTLTATGNGKTVTCITNITVVDPGEPTPTPTPVVVVEEGKGDLPSSGPVEAAAGAVGLTATGGAAFAWLRSKKDLLKAIRKVK